MGIEKITIPALITNAAQYPVLDVRSPGEFVHARFPGAVSLPLFTDEERKVVGTLYKQQGKQVAIKKGLEYFGPKMLPMVEAAEKITALKTGQLPTEKAVIVHCWRGGMRSAGVGWLLNLYGFNVYTVIGGYKAFRRWALAQLEKQYSLQIIGGFTGSGKTKVLHELAKAGETVIDLEALAAHKGSAFGSFGMPPQPSQEMFENELALALYKAAATGKVIWMEDESQRIGDVNIPSLLRKHMRTQPVYFLDIPFAQRLQYIIQEYGQFEKEKMVNAIMRIKKRLGGLETKTAINALLEDDITTCFAQLLTYYDKWYAKSSFESDVIPRNIQKITAENIDAIANAAMLLAEQKTKQA